MPMPRSRSKSVTKGRRAKAKAKAQKKAADKANKHIQKMVEEGNPNITGIKPGGRYK